VAQILGAAFGRRPRAAEASFPREEVSYSSWSVALIADVARENAVYWSSIARRSEHAGRSVPAAT